MLLLIITCVSLLILKILLDWKRGPNFPPGPRGVPLLGNMLDMKNLMKESKFFSVAISKLTEKYGPVVGLKMGLAEPFILVSGRDAIVEMLTRPEFDGRPDTYAFRFRTFGKRRGMVFTEGKVWSDHRKFAQRSLKDLGIERSTMEDLILENVHSLMDTLEKNSTNGIIKNFSKYSSVSILNNIWSLIGGTKLSDDNTKLQEAVEMLYNLARHTSASGGLLDHFPFLRYFMPEISGYNALKERHRGIKRFLEVELARHKNMKDENIHNDMITAYFEEIEKKKNDPTSSFDELELFALTKDFFSAGLETTNNSLGFFVSYIAVRKDIQKRIQDELDNEIGRDARPSLIYRNNLPYLNATIAEVLRISHVAPTTVPHRALKDSTLFGYEIKKNYTLIANLVSLHMDKEHWGDPEIFRPERFINDKGEFVEDSWLMPFGTGRRRCIGGSVAKNSLFLFTASLLQKYNFSLPPGEPLPCLTGINGMTSAPPNCRLLLTKLMWIPFLCCFFILVFKVLLDWIRETKFPPGPRGLPILGNILDLKKLLNEKKYLSHVYRNLAETYGPIVGLKLGIGHPIILVSGRDAVLEMLSRPEFDGRPDTFSHRFRTMGERRGIIFTDGKMWDDNRRFSLKYLKEFGFGKRSMEDLILENAVSLTIKIEKKIEQENIIEYFCQISNIAVLNNLWCFIAGTKLKEDDHRVKEALDNLNGNTRKSSVSGVILDHLPFLRFIIPRLTGFTDLKERQNRMWNFFKDELNAHKNSKIEGSYRDLIDVYLDEINAQKKDSSSTFNEFQLLALIKDFFSAGVETTNNSLGFAITFIAINKEVQEKLHDELDKAIGRESLPSLTYKNQLPYLSATIAEVLRISNIGPTTIAHRAVVDSKLLGYNIKKNYAILASLVSVNMDKNHWGDPETFRPERFIDKNGKFVDDAWALPFGAGKRRCLGEVLAKHTLLLFTACLLQKFNFQLAPGESTPCMDGIDGFAVAPPICRIMITKR
ncbi:uncharacterized protein LOC127291258 [Leptopilina boulardi]|uniref:uncharacterized protein LOC127291258 n=1 Tax=Leptopilina boulardi TaxID=63433 RepID=UPI0021F54B93|nr:uncharacterized protein LOC127291258 [Leptopilina boulardi]